MRFLSEEEARFWKRMYLAAVAAKSALPKAIANSAVRDLRDAREAERGATVKES